MRPTTLPFADRSNAGIVAAALDLRVLGVAEEVARHELDDQRDVDVDRSFELGEVAGSPVKGLRA